MKICLIVSVLLLGLALFQLRQLRRQPGLIREAEIRAALPTQSVHPPIINVPAKSGPPKGLVASVGGMASAVQSPATTEAERFNRMSDSEVRIETLKIMGGIVDRMNIAESEVPRLKAVIAGYEERDRHRIEFLRSRMMHNLKAPSPLTLAFAVWDREEHCLDYAAFMEHFTNLTFAFTHKPTAAVLTNGIWRIGFEP